MIDLNHALQAATDAAHAAGRIALGYYRDGTTVTLKADGTPVTAADREAERAIVAILGAAFPECGFLGEEHGPSGNQEVRWIVDPIDGTKNFVRHIPIWATLIALEDRGEIVAGVINNPVTGELYAARRGGGAFLNGSPVRVSPIKALADAMLVHSGLNLLRGAGYWDGFVRLIDATARQRGFGDYFGHGLLAEGKADIYMEVGVKPWDLAACKIVVEEAGGRFTDFHGDATIYTGTGLATNGYLHDDSLALLRGTHGAGAGYTAPNLGM